MSWSISFIGKPENVAKALNEHSDKLDGQSKLEYINALPNIIGIVSENFGNQDQLLKVTASGHGYAVNGEQKQRQCSVNVEVFYSVLV